MAVSGLTCLVLWLLVPLYGSQASPLVGISLAVAMAAWWGGLGPGLLTTALCSLFSWWALVPPAYTFELPDLKESLRLLLTVLTGTVISALAEASHRAATRQLRAMTELRLVNTALEAAANGIAISDRQGILIWVNQAFTELTGYSRAEAIGQNPRLLKSGQHAPEFYRQMWATLSAGKVWQGELVNRRKDGTRYTEEMTITPVRASDDVITHYVAVKVDVTERNKNQEALRASEARLAWANAELEQKVKERTAELQTMVDDLEHFSYSITHDMRAPLRAMRSFADLLLMKPKSSLAEEEREHLRRIATAAKHMDDLVVDALAYSKVVRDELPLSPVDPAVVIQEMLATYPDLQPVKSNIQILGALPPVLANRAGLLQVFSNLLRNAIKFVAPGVRPAVQISAEIRDGWVRLWFADNGIGIPPAFRGRLFKMFERANHDYEGTGIGLALVHKVTQRMHGRVGVESEPGQGSRFWVELPAAGNPEIRTEKGIAPHRPDR